MGNVYGKRYIKVESDNAAYLNLWNDEPKLNANHVDNANPNFGSASCGSFPRGLLYNVSSLLSFFLPHRGWMKGLDTFFREGFLYPLQGGEELLTSRVQYLSFSGKRAYHRFEGWRKGVLLFLRLYRRVFDPKYIFYVWEKKLLFRLTLYRNYRFS